MLSKKATDEFKKIWLEEFGEEISDQKATEEGINLLTLFNTIYRPIKKKWVDESETPIKEDKTAKNDTL